MKASLVEAIILLILGGFFGYLGNIYANRKNNQELIAMLKEQGLLIQAQLKSGRLSQQETNFLIQKQQDIQNQIDRINKQNLNLL